ncbi:FeoA family protein [Tepidanaerobacter acetatoxydans]|uniref:FeoA family protein n=1 Tax=Tepidanaerobacter acetatoxydans TaxID=499229 RepID=UPI00020BFCFA|nr:FeoA domain-containing protein [Tepidanaerobacter acetatoxydans]AEE90464.1 FeoA family protein [Tepidanaerobacter acetatoxydans Re1]
MAQPLVFFSEGTRGRIYDICGGREVSKRLFEMGLNKGQEIEVVKNDAGPVVVGLNGSRIAVGRGMAFKILLDTIDN